MAYSSKIFFNTVLQLSCTAVLFLFALNSFSNDKNGIILGTVIDEQNNSTISDVKLILSSDNYKYESSTDLSGSFEFKNLPDGIYTISLNRLGYILKTENNISVENGSIKNLKVFMTPIDIEIERINVTAAKTELTLRQTPSSINIVTAEDIKNKNPLTFDNILSTVQGVTVFRTSGINIQGLSIRGSSDVAGGGIGNRVLLLLDGRPSLTGDSKGALWSLIPISIIERTEVVKGAFSSLYGSSAIGGVVNVITKKPAYKPFTGVNMNYGFYEKLNDSLKFSDKLQSFKGIDILHSNTINKLAYLINLNYRQNDGHAQQTDYEFYSGIGKIMYDVFANRDLEVTLQYTRSSSGFPHYWRKDPGKYAEPYKVSDYYIGDRIKKETQSIDVFYKAIPSSDAKYTTRFYYYKLFSLSYFNPSNFVSQQYAPHGQALETNINSYNFGNISQVDLSLGQRNYLIAGLDIQWNVVRSDPASILYGNQQVNNFGVFVQDQYKIIKDKSGSSILSATGGFRFDYNSYVGFNNFTELSPKISFIYSPAAGNIFFENTSFRFLAGTAFRAPSIAELYFKKELFGGFDFIFNPKLKPEKMFSAEAGFRKQYDKRFTLDISAYINEYDNLIQYVNVGSGINGPFQVQNIAKAQIKGVEFYIDYMSGINILNERLGYGFSFNYSLIDAKDLSANRKDDFLPYKPMHVLNFSTDLSWFGFHMNVSGKYQSRVDEDLFFKYEEPDEHFVLDMKLSKRLFDKVSVFGAVNNVLNASYQELERTQAPNRNFNAGFGIEF